MFNNMTGLRLDDKSQRARSKGKKTVQCTHCAVHCQGSMHLVALNSQTITGFSELTFNEYGRRWIWVFNAFHIHGKELHIYGRAFHIHGKAFQKTCHRMRLFAFLMQFIL